MQDDEQNSSCKKYKFNTLYSNYIIKMWQYEGENKY